ncbi:trypsin-like serine peptidase [Pseudooceanicola pacificus]|uniref:trypsin-like serine peptidase n=1 Tax=Pseudooceanicola pacificus TaxID=2676438 RepID=UPI001365E48B|nr:serine protease [Pseudooceanicola pacificus]
MSEELSDKALEALRRHIERSTKNIDQQNLDEFSFFAAERTVRGAGWLQFAIGDLELGPRSYVLLQSALDGQTQVIDERVGETEHTLAFNGDTVIVYIATHPLDLEFEKSLQKDGFKIKGAIWGVEPEFNKPIKPFSLDTESPIVLKEGGLLTLKSPLNTSEITEAARLLMQYESRKILSAKEAAQVGRSIGRASRAINEAASTLGAVAGLGVGYVLGRSAGAAFGAGLGTQSTVESVCGNDDRIPSKHPFVGRVMPVGCTGWISTDGVLLTAGHCVGPTMLDIEFDVPNSTRSGVPVRSALKNQYSIIPKSVRSSEPFEMGNDWAVFEVARNTITGLSVFEAQGDGFVISQLEPPETVRVIGYGTDNTPLSRNQTQQEQVGGFVSELVRASDNVILKHKVDTSGGNSGSPLMGVSTEGKLVAFGIHTNAGCMGGGGSNNATGFKHQSLYSHVKARNLVGRR